MSQRYVWLIVGVVVLGLVIWGANVNDTAPLVSGSPTPGAVVGGTPTPGASRAPVPRPQASTATAPSNMEYSQALAQYAGRVIQFNAYCQTTPYELNVKNGTNIMFDNRSGDARWISLNGVGYQIAGYGFRILPLTSKRPPETVVIDCGSAQNVGRIIVQP